MPWTYAINSITHSDTTQEIFGQLQFSGNYTAGGDAAGAIKLGGNTAGLPQFLPVSALHAGAPPLANTVQLDGGYLGVLVPGSGPENFKLKVINPATNAELVAGAYPASLTAALYSTLRLTYLKNL